jgi:hypothetical protein
MDGNMLNVYLPDWLNVIFFPVFRHLPLKTGRVLAKSAPSHKLSFQSPFPHLATPHTYKLAPQPGHLFVTTRLKLKATSFSCFGTL